MTGHELQAIIEAVLFVAPDPVSVEALVELLGDAHREQVERALAGIRGRYPRDDADRGVFLEHVAGGYRLVTRPELNDYLESFFQARGRSRLSMPALETLTIIAYRQPVTAPEIQELRGVNSSTVIKTLLEHGLIRISGRKQVVGKPFLYRTTGEFLQHFGLATIDDLPPLEDFEEGLVSLEAQSVMADLRQREQPADDEQSAGLQEDLEFPRDLDEASADDR